MLAVYNVGFLGAAPIGAFVLGQLAAHIGILDAVKFAALGMYSLLLVTAFSTGFWNLRRDD